MSIGVELLRLPKNVIVIQVGERLDDSLFRRTALLEHVHASVRTRMFDYN